MISDKEDSTDARTPLSPIGPHRVKKKKSTVNWRQLQFPIIFVFMIVISVGMYNVSSKLDQATISPKKAESPLIIIITPTYKRITRMADMLRIVQTLMFVDNIFWVVVEDGAELSKQVAKLLKRSNIPHHYLSATTEFGWPKKGWCQRNKALDWITEHFEGHSNHAVVYFMDDDNAYDYRLFDKYIRNVKRIGIWAVGLVGDSLVEAPHVVNGIITKWDVFYSPRRDFAVDMAGFAVGLPLLLEKRPRLRRDCPGKVPETCLLKQLGVPKEKAEAFGWEEEPKEVLVWHVKTTERVPRGVANWGYDVESLNSKEWIEHRNYSRTAVGTAMRHTVAHHSKTTTTTAKPTEAAVRHGHGVRTHLKYPSTADELFNDRISKGYKIQTTPKTGHHRSKLQTTLTTGHKKLNTELHEETRAILANEVASEHKTNVETKDYKKFD